MLDRYLQLHYVRIHPLTSIIHILLSLEILCPQYSLFTQPSMRYMEWYHFTSLASLMLFLTFSSTNLRPSKPSATTTDDPVIYLSSVPAKSPQPIILRKASKPHKNDDEDSPFSQPGYITSPKESPSISPKRFSPLRSSQPSPLKIPQKLSSTHPQL
ncbi:hypothetical protein BC829DRAFT_275362 [Chytridium lagenaria]|nr:hypothetical protein BC829DRAFT_275362 [Chytridium lagenaria]